MQQAKPLERVSTEHGVGGQRLGERVVEGLAGFRGICFALLDGGDADQYGSMGIEGHSFSSRIGSRGPPGSGA